jgi:hypothetical protein
LLKDFFGCVAILGHTYCEPAKFASSCLVDEMRNAE